MEVIAVFHGYTFIVTRSRGIDMVYNNNIIKKYRKIKFENGKINHKRAFFFYLLLTL